MKVVIIDPKFLVQHGRWFSVLESRRDVRFVLLDDTLFIGRICAHSFLLALDEAMRENELGNLNYTTLNARSSEIEKERGREAPRARRATSAGIAMNETLEILWHSGSFGDFSPDPEIEKAIH
jgi:hypothetical protein